MKHSEGAAAKSTGSGLGGVRNSMAVDEAGGIYVASQAHQHELVGTGDRFVCLTDGDAVMNMILFWRVAAMLPAHMRDPERPAIQSEQSVVVAGDGAFVVNNRPGNAPWWLPKIARGVLIGWLGAHPDDQPYGVREFAWNPEARRIEMACVNHEVSSPSCVAIASYASHFVYLIGARGDRWTLEALDRETGKSAFHHGIGAERFDPLFSGTNIDEAGRIHYATSRGRVRLDPHGGVCD